MPLEATEAEAFTVVTEERMPPPLRVPQVVLNATSHLQATMEQDVMVHVTG